MKYAYFNGCVSDQSARENDMAARAVSRKLGIELVDLPFNCCGGGLVHEVDVKAAKQLNTYNLELAGREKLDLMTICSVCNFALKLSNSDRGATTHRIKSFEEVVILDIGPERIRNLIKRKLTGINIAPFYGCKSLRPGSMNPFGDSVDPRYLDDFIRLLGGEPVKYNSSKKCCGFPDLYVNRNLALTMGSKILKDARNNNADIIVTPCPLCQMTLDVYQGRMGKISGESFYIPVLHFSQLLGLALGIPSRELGLNMNITTAEPLVIK